MITRALLKTLLFYDENTGHWIWLRRPHIRSRQKPGDAVGSVTMKGYRHICIKGKRYYSSRLAFLYMTGVFPEKLVDHIDGDPLNDAWCNLREADYKQNGMNRKKNKSSWKKNITKLHDGSYRVTVGMVTYAATKEIELAKLIASELRDKLFGEFSRHE